MAFIAFRGGNPAILGRDYPLGKGETARWDKGLPKARGGVVGPFRLARAKVVTYPPSNSQQI